jgi:hypothetical protein
MIEARPRSTQSHIDADYYKYTALRAHTLTYPRSRTGAGTRRASPAPTVVRSRAHDNIQVTTTPLSPAHATVSALHSNGDYGISTYIRGPHTHIINHKSSSTPAKAYDKKSRKSRCPPADPLFPLSTHTAPPSNDPPRPRPSTPGSRFYTRCPEVGGDRESPGDRARG